MECWNLAFNAQGLKVIIVVVHVGTIKMYVGAMKSFLENERGGQNKMKISLSQKMWWNFATKKKNQTTQKKGEYKEQNGRTYVQRTTKEGKPHKKHQVLKPLLVARSISNK